MIKKVIENFDIKGELIDIREISTGIINNTFVATMKLDDGTYKKYLVQKINTNVFTQPSKLMKNIVDVTTYLKKQMMKEDDHKHQVLEVIKTKDGKNLSYVDREGTRDSYRVFDFIDNTETYDCSKDKNVVFNTGKAFGNFQRLLNNFPISKLSETIPNFHNTYSRFKNLYDDVIVDPVDRVKDVTKEIVFFLRYVYDYSQITSKIGTDDIPYRVTHNDTKVNNVLMDKKTGDYVAVIDLDTVMPGSLLYDYGDGIRSTCSKTAEDEKDLSKVGINLELFEAYTDGYLSEMASYLTDAELDLMGESIKIITLELGIRFLNDYINGDAYFKTNYKEHNLDRARNQIALVKEIEKNMEYINSYIFNSYNKYISEKTNVKTKKI